MTRLHATFFVLLFCLPLVACGTVSAQDDPTPTPFSPIVPQGFSNLGNVQPRELQVVAQDTGISDWQAANWTGLGRRIGVLDRGFGGLLDFEARHGITVTTAFNVDKTEYDENPVSHGVQVLDVIHGLAPGAELHVCQYDSLNTFIRCIDWMLRSQIHIINHSAGVPALPLDGQGQWAQEVNRITSQGTLWINAAGNFASGYISDVLTDLDNDGLHEFRGVPDDPQALSLDALPIGTSGVVMLSWLGNGGQPANQIDLDLQVINADTGDFIAGSFQQQNGQPNQQPLEVVRINMGQPFAVQIRDADGASVGTNFSLFVEFVTLPGGQSLSSIIAPGDAVGSLTVAALQEFNVAPYSSRGPLTTGGVKPDIAAPGEIMLPSGPFIGTSAAAPVVAAAAALIWEANPTFDADAVRANLLNSAQNPDEFDFAIGRGRMLLPFPDTIAPPPATESPRVGIVPTGTPAAPTGTPTPTSTDTPAAPTETTPTPGAPVDQFDLTLIWDANDLSLVIDAPTYPITLSDLRLLVADPPLGYNERVADYQQLQTSNGSLLDEITEATCIHFRFEEEPPPSACAESERFILIERQSSDIFWFDDVRVVPKNIEVYLGDVLLETCTSSPCTIAPAESAENEAEVQVVPTAVPSPNPEQLAMIPVTANADWTPYERDFNGVTMVLVPAGEFEMGSTDSEVNFGYLLCEQAENSNGDCQREWYEIEAPAHTQEVEPFWIDQTEVTRGNYLVCVRDGVCDAPPSSEFSTGSDQPINRITWFQASDYCEWRDARLPTEMEWEYAARGPDGLRFPWGNDYFGDEANHCDSLCGQQDFFGDWGYVLQEHDDGYTFAAPVGSYPQNASWVGALDLSGNVWEWVSSIFGVYPYVSRRYEGTTNLTLLRVRRGGAYSSGMDVLRGAARIDTTPSREIDNTGFRCARDFD